MRPLALDLRGAWARREGALAVEQVDKEQFTRPPARYSGNPHQVLEDEVGRPSPMPP